MTKINLEVFEQTQSTPDSTTRSSDPDPAILEQIRLEAYESGYKTGWNDALKSDEAEQEKIGVEFSRNLQDLGFTFHEARTHVMNTLEPFLNGIVEKILPQTFAQSIGQTVLEELLNVADQNIDAPIEIVTAPANLPTLERFLPQETSLPFTLTEEPSLAEGQIFLRSGNIEKRVDFAEAQSRIKTAIQDLFELNGKAFKHG